MLLPFIFSTKSTSNSWKVNNKWLHRTFRSQRERCYQSSFLLSTMILVAFLLGVCKIALSYPVEMRHGHVAFCSPGTNKRRNASKVVSKSQWVLTTHPPPCLKGQWHPTCWLYCQPISVSEDGWPGANLPNNPRSICRMSKKYLGYDVLGRFGCCLFLQHILGYSDWYKILKIYQFQQIQINFEIVIFHNLRGRGIHSRANEMGRISAPVNK